MYKVTIDTTAVAQQFGAKAEMILDRALDALGEFALHRIKQRTEDLAPDTQARYLRSVKSQRSKMQYTITLDDDQMSRLEVGYPSFDIKEGLLKGPNVKMGKTGPYQDVSFLHRTTKRGAGRFISSKGMRGAVQRAVRAVRATGEPQRLFKRVPGSPRTKLTDMKVASETAGGKARVSARTFRRVSLNSDPGSWIHPGYEGLDIFKDVAREVEDNQQRVIDDIARTI